MASSPSSFFRQFGRNKRYFAVVVVIGVVIMPENMGEDVFLAIVQFQGKNGTFCVSEEDENYGPLLRIF